MQPSALERKGQRAYAAFVASLNELLPPLVQTWAEMHPRVREAWIAAAEAARNDPEES
jgi:hypothetical protein